MARHWKARHRGLSEKDKKFLFQGCLAAMILVVVTVLSFAGLFTRNCIFHWPPRLNAQCWNEQKAPAHEKGLEAAGPFVP